MTWVCRASDYGVLREGHTGEHLFTSPNDEIRRRLAYEEDVKILFGRSALVTGIPGPHARARMAAVATENRLRERVDRYTKQLHA